MEGKETNVVLEKTGVRPAGVSNPSCRRGLFSAKPKVVLLPLLARCVLAGGWWAAFSAPLRDTEKHGVTVQPAASRGCHSRTFLQFHSMKDGRAGALSHAHPGCTTHWDTLNTTETAETGTRTEQTTASTTHSATRVVLPLPRPGRTQEGLLEPAGLELPTVTVFPWTRAQRGHSSADPAG